MDEVIALESEVIAIVEGKPFTQVPKDLFIPPDALEVLLDTFNGPLDLLLYLIRRQNIDILNIPMSIITEQYLKYIQIMKERRLELAADYLVMAALLIEIKSRMLLPKKADETVEEDEDPRMTLVRRLQAYEQIKHGAEFLDNLPRQDRDTFPVKIPLHPHFSIEKVYPPLSLNMLTAAMNHLFKRQSHLVRHQVMREPMCVKERMALVLERINPHEFTELHQLLVAKEGRLGLVVTLLAILELSKQFLLTIMQVQHFASIRIKAIQHGPA